MSSGPLLRIPLFLLVMAAATESQVDLKTNQVDTSSSPPRRHPSSPSGAAAVVVKRRKTSPSSALVVQSSSEVTLHLQGKWREARAKRTGLNDMLYYLGMPWWKRLYVVSTSWENEQTIFQKGHTFRINGYKGPHMEVYSFTLRADNATQTRVSLGDLGGGWLTATALLEGEGDGQSLVASMFNAETGKEEVVQRWTRRKGSNIMVHETEHLPSSAVLRSYYFKQ